MFWTSIIIFVLASCTSSCQNRIDENEAIVRFQELADKNPDDNITPKVVIVRQSNPSMVFGDAWDVTYELEVDGVPASGRCTSGDFSKMVCRLCGPGGA